MVNTLIENGDDTCKDLAHAIICLVGTVNDLIKKDSSIPDGLFAKYIYNMIGVVCNISPDRPKCNPSTEYSQIDKKN